MSEVWRWFFWMLWVISVGVFPAVAGTNVAVFNFQMTSETPEWVWLEKGLSDRIATDFTQSRVLTVTARDAMQVLAQKLNWVPEMATSDYYAGNMDAAIMQFMRTMDLDLDYIEAHYWSGMAYSRLGEDAHAVIEWKKFLKRQPKSKHAKQVKKMLAGAKAREKDSTVERLGPKSRPAKQTTKPATRPAKGEKTE